jgi:hypothetical protein
LGAHWPAQQSAPTEQAAPSGLHMVPPQKPLAHDCPAQHVVWAVHAEPVGVHAVPPQKPPMQSSPQQSVVRAQATPSGWQR